MVLATCAACLAVAAGAAFAPAAGATALPIPAPGVADPLEGLAVPGDTVKLSDEKLITRWANSTTRSPIRTAARKTARTITRLRYFTEDGKPEVYLVLDGKLDARGDPWLHIRIPMRPNGRKGWVPADMLSGLHTVRTQLI